MARSLADAILLGMADSDDESRLHNAAEANDVEALRRLLSQGGVDPRGGLALRLLVLNLLIYTITPSRGYRKLGLLRHLVRHQRVVVRLFR